MGETRIYREEGPVTEVCLEPFEIWSHEVSNAQFAKFVKATGYKTRAERGWNAKNKSGHGVDMAPSSAVFVPPKNPKGMNWWALMEGANWEKPLGPEQAAYDPSVPVVHITREAMRNGRADAYQAKLNGNMRREAG